MGGLFKSKTTTTQQPFEQNPWKPQQPYLTEGFAGAKDALTNFKAADAKIPSYTAGMTPEQLAAIKGGTSFSMGATAAGKDLMNSGAYAAGALGGYTDNARNLTAAAGADRTDKIIENAGKFSDNPHIQALIDSSLGDVRKAFDRNVGDINSAATGVGSINSTRAGTLEAYAADDAMDRAAQISSGIRSDAWNKGITTASGNLSDQFTQSLGANGQLGDAANLGVNTVGAGYDLGAGAFGNAYGMSSEQQKQAQAEIDGLRAKGMSEQEAIQRYMATIGGSYGSQGFQSTTTKSASPFQQIVGGVTSMLGAWGGLKGG